MPATSFNEMNGLSKGNENIPVTVLGPKDSGKSTTPRYVLRCYYSILLVFSGLFDEYMDVLPSFLEPVKGARLREEIQYYFVCVCVGGGLA
jgi:hypothetical protein